MKNNTKVTIEEKRKNEKNKSNHKPTWKRLLTDIRTYMVLVYGIALVALFVQIVMFNVLPMKYFIPGTIVLLLISAGLLWLQYSNKINKINRILGNALIILLSAVMLVGNMYIWQTNHAINEITVKEGDTAYEIISVVVKKDSSAEELKDVKSGKFAIPEKIDIEYTKQTVKDINEQLSTTISTINFANTNDQAKALLSDEVDAMILNESYRSLLDENYPSFGEDTKIIYEFKIAKEVKKLGEKVDILKDPYNVYISGIDTYGPIATNSRSDVNMIATINPSTKEVLLTSIPRDYYVPQVCQGNQEDKLTHSGIFGIDCTIDSMQNFTGLTFNYYVRVNFSSLEGIVNAIGGIEIYNQMSFYSGVDSSFIPGGNIHVNGNTALKFARERHAYADGDRQRGRNQMIVLEAIIEKAISPAIITGYSGIMETVGANFQTNMDKNEMTSIIKDQLDNGGDWTIVQQSVTGEGADSVWSPANGFPSWVMYPDQTSVDTALANVKTIMDGGSVTIDAPTE